jgi:hypothetical protein
MPVSASWVEGLNVDGSPVGVLLRWEELHGLFSVQVGVRSSTPCKGQLTHGTSSDRALLPRCIFACMEGMKMTSKCESEYNVTSWHEVQHSTASAVLLHESNAWSNIYE